MRILNIEPSLQQIKVSYIMLHLSLLRTLKEPFSLFLDQKHTFK